MMNRRSLIDDSISKREAIEAINTWDKFGVDERGRLVRWHEGLEPYVHLRDVLTAIVNLPSVQSEIIHCKDCKHWFDIDDGRQKHRMCADIYGDWYCADAERRTDE